MKLIKFLLFLVLSNVGLNYCMDGSDTEETALSSASSSKQSIKIQRNKLQASISDLYDRNVIRGYRGLELLFEPENYFFDTFSIFHSDDEKYKIKDLIRCVNDIRDNHANIIEPIYRLFALVKKSGNFDLQNAIRYIDNSSIGQSEKELEKAKKFVTDYFSIQRIHPDLIHILSIYGVKKRLVDQNGIVKKLFFSPLNIEDDSTKIEETIIWLINAEKESIRVASYCITCNDIIWALHEACNRGVQVHVIADDREYNKKIMKQNEFSFKIWVKQSKYCQMHHKFILFSKNIDNNKIVAFGSYNMTNNANTQPENMMFSNDTYIYDRFFSEYNKLAKGCSWQASDFDLKCKTIEEDYNYYSASLPSSNSLHPEEPASVISKVIDLQLKSLAVARKMKQSTYS